MKAFKDFSEEVKNKIYQRTKETDSKPHEAKQYLDSLFNKSDANKDGKLNLEEFKSLCVHHEEYIRETCGDSVKLTDDSMEGRFKAYDLENKGFVNQ